MTSHKLSSGVMIYDASPLLMFILNKKDLNIQNMTIFILLVIILVDHFSMSITTILGKSRTFWFEKFSKSKFLEIVQKNFWCKSQSNYFIKVCADPEKITNREIHEIGLSWKVGDETLFDNPMIPNEEELN